MPVAAVNVTTALVEVTFSVDLVAGALDAGNWTLDVGLADAAEAVSPNVVRLMHSGGANATRVRYTPPPFDVMSTDGEPAQAFMDFPVT